MNEKPTGTSFPSMGILGIEILVRLRMIMLGAGSIGMTQDLDNKERKGTTVVLPGTEVVVRLWTDISDAEMVQMHHADGNVLSEPLDVRDPVAFAITMHNIDSTFAHARLMAPLNRIINTADVLYSNPESQELVFLMARMGNRFDLGEWQGRWLPSKELEILFNAGFALGAVASLTDLSNFEKPSLHYWQEQCSRWILGPRHMGTTTNPDLWRSLANLKQVRACFLRMNVNYPLPFPWAPMNTSTGFPLEGEFWLLESGIDSTPILLAYRQESYLLVIASGPDHDATIKRHQSDVVLLMESRNAKGEDPYPHEENTKLS